MSFSVELKIAREKAGLTQQQIADRMNIDKSTYCGYETGKRQPDVRKIKQLSEVLNVSADDLLEIKIEKTTGISSDGKYDDIIKKLDRLTPEQVCRVEGFIDCMLMDAAETAAEQANEELA